MELLTPKDVSKLLKIGMSTVYDHANKLGGFYPAGIRVLRFKKDYVYGLLERSQDQKMEISVSIPGADVLQAWLRDEKRRHDGQGIASESIKRESRTDDRRHGF